MEKKLRKFHPQSDEASKMLMYKIQADELERYINEFTNIQLLYKSALREINTKLEILNDEFQSMHEYNPIEHIKSRVKTPKSIIDKLIRKGFPLSLDVARKELNDLAGVRVICSFIDDIYMIADMLISQDDVTLIKMTDYIKNPKPNGYRSLHLVVEIPVYFSNRMERVRVEVQIRTVAMDFWASLEHKLRYKYDGTAPEDVVEELRECSEQIRILDEKMTQINRTIRGTTARNLSVSE
ncbi:GTP pyrophosphokinase family protein [Clostridium thermosuccinogenes]|uniref:GTP pyrophosphokinase n=1 Tax=Clostridium thermosuccinogenes TaxID=84032 RepID=UPI0030F6EDA9